MNNDKKTEKETMEPDIVRFNDRCSADVAVSRCETGTQCTELC